MACKTTFGRAKPHAEIPVFVSFLLFQNLATIDTERGIFYMMGFNDSTNDVNLLGFDTNGTLKYNILLPFISSEFVGVGEAVDVDTTNGEVFCMGLKADGKHHLYRVNPRTGVLK